MSKVIPATILALSLLGVGVLYRIATRNRSDNPAFRAIFANAVTVKIAFPARTPKSKKVTWTTSQTLSSKSHPKQLQWFRATNHFSPYYLECPWDGGAIVVIDSDGTEHILSYYGGALKCDDLPRATAPTGTAIMSPELSTWIEKAKSHHTPLK